MYDRTSIKHYQTFFTASMNLTRQNARVLFKLWQSRDQANTIKPMVNLILTRFSHNYRVWFLVV